MRPLVILTVAALMFLNVGVAIQAMFLQRIFRSPAWSRLAWGFIMLAMRFFWNLLALPGPISGRASWQWWVGMAAGLAGYTLVALGLHDLRRSLHRMGVRGREFG